MASSSVTLGGITLRGHEVPEKINFGGRQKLAKHVLVGGKRVVDAMGPEECDPKWSGRFRGNDALARARSLDQMRKRGAQVPCTYGGLYYLVVIEEFEADYQRSFDIPYRIELYVISDGGGGGEVFTSLDSLVGGDLAAAVGLVGSFLSDPVGTALGALDTAVSGIGSLLDAPLSAIAPIQDIAANAVGAVDAAIQGADARIATVGGLDPALLTGPAFAKALFDQSAALSDQDALLRSRGLVGRVEVNLKTITG